MDPLTVDQLLFAAGFVVGGLVLVKLGVLPVPGEREDDDHAER